LAAALSPNDSSRSPAGIARLGRGLGTAGYWVIGGIGLVASVVKFAAWARKQIVRWGS
jgi:hypothetical protein